MVSSSCSELVARQKVVVGEEQLVDRREQLDGCLQVDEVVPAVGHGFDAEIWPVADAAKIQRGRTLDLPLLRAQFAIDVDHEVEQVQVVFQEQVVAQVRQIFRLERPQWHAGARHVARDEIEDFAAHVKVP